MADTSIELMLTTRAVFPVPAGGYHYELMKMEHAYALEAALQAKGDYFGSIMRAIHPDFYPDPNPNPYYDKKAEPNPYQGLVGFRFEVLGTDDIREAYQTVYDIIHATIGENHPELYVGEVSVSRMGVSRENRYHPKHRP